MADGAGNDAKAEPLVVPPESDVEGGSALPLTNVPPDPEVGKGFLKPLPETTLMERIAGGVAAAAVVTALAAIIVEQSAVVIVGGLLSAVVGPYAYWQQTRLTDIKALQETQHAVKAEVDKLQQENVRLGKNVDELTTSVQHLEDVQQALSAITSTQDHSIDTFKKQVEDNKTILKQMQSNLKASVLQNLLSVILRSDTDGDLVIDEAEIASLVRRIQNISGVNVNEDRFRQAISGKSVQAVMEIVKNLLNDDTPPDQRIFELAQ